MHLSVKHAQTLEEAELPQNPEQTGGKMLFLSFTDSDLSCMEEAYAQLADDAPSLRLSRLARLMHPLSVDLYLEQVAAGARVIVIRLLGGYDWWRYGVDEFARFARERGIALVIMAGDGRPDHRLTERSTLAPEIVSAFDACLTQGGVENTARVLQAMTAMAKGESISAPECVSIAHGSLYRCMAAKASRGKALLLFYRAHYLAADTKAIDALLEALADQGLEARAFMVTSLKDKQALLALRAEIAAHPPHILLDATAFSAGSSDAHPLSECDVPILQVALANAERDAWRQSARGLSASDLAMHVVLPEADGRIFTRAVSFKERAVQNEALEFSALKQVPVADRVTYVAKLAARWAKLSQTPACERRLALVLSDYPGRAGRNAYAVGLDAPQSAMRILQMLRAEGYEVSLPKDGGALIQSLRTHSVSYTRAQYDARLHALPESLCEALHAAWGAPENDPVFANGVFQLNVLQMGNCYAALQPDRGSSLDRKSGYHDPVMPPRHGYLAFYWWLLDVANIDAMMHLGTHGNLEWLPGKTVALTNACWPEVALGPMPVIYPYIVSDPGEAAQAKRRIVAVTLSHLTPPLADVELTPDLMELERLVDEFSSAEGLDARRMRLLKQEILHRARQSGFADANDDDDNAMLNALEAQLCDIKEQRVRDGLHIFAQGACAEAEKRGLIAALSGRFIAPSPGGSPSRGRLDVLPTGRNLIAMDPRTVPTRTAATIGRRAAEEFIRRYVQDHGEYPRHVMMDVWGSSSLRTGGDEVAQALWLMGVQPVWDASSDRVTGFEIIAHESLSWPRVDVALRISGLFRDMFSHLITLFDDAVRAVAALENRNAGFRIFGNAPGAYGAGVTERLDSGRWQERHELGDAYLAATQFAYGRDAEGIRAKHILHECVGNADAFIHVQDQRESDVLDGADFADAEGGFAAAAASLKADAALYHVDSTNPDAIKARTLAEEITLVLHARALNPKWMEGQMRHGYAGAAAFAEVVDQLFAFAATARAVTSAQFDAAFERYILDESVRGFIAEYNPEALGAMLDTFEEAASRDLWQPLRNSTRPLLEELRGAKREAA